MSGPRPVELFLGAASESKGRQEDFLDGRLRIHSRDGLRPSERALLPVLPKGKSGRALVIDSRFAVLGYALRVLNPDLEVCCHYDDAWYSDEASEMVKRQPDTQITIDLGADPPPGPYEVIVLPLERRGVTDLVRERIRLAANTWLARGGLLYSSSDTSEDRFVRDEIKKAFGALHIAPETEAPRHHAGVGYVSRRPAAQLVAPPYSYTTFTIPEGEEILKFQSRLGVFCCDRIDPGSRALLTLADFTESRHVLDLGCGSGVVGIIAALRQPEARITFLDSNARAVEVTKRNVEQFGISDRSNLVLSADPIRAFQGGELFDTIVTNPPYYGNWRIAELFLDSARRLLHPGGRLQLVTKGPDWYLTELQNGFSAVREERRGGYTVVRADRVKR